MRHTGDSKGSPSRPPPAVRRVARGKPERAVDRVSGDRRLSSRASVPLPSELVAVNTAELQLAARAAAHGSSRPPGARERRHPGRDLPAFPRDRVAARRGSRTAPAPPRARRRLQGGRRFRPGQVRARRGPGACFNHGRRGSRGVHKGHPDPAQVPDGSRLRRGGGLG